MISTKPSSLNWPIKLSLCIGIGVPGIALIVYLFQKHKNNENVVEEQYDSIIKTRQKIIELKIPSNSVSSIIGPQGKVIKEVIEFHLNVKNKFMTDYNKKVQKKTNTRINFKDKPQKKNDSNNSDETNQDCILVIRGASLNVGLAELEIKKILLDMPVFLTEEYYVPDYACGRIIGSKGSNIKEISSASSCRVKLIDRIGTSSSCSSIISSNSNNASNKISDEILTEQNVAKKVVSITGSYEQIQYAKELIMAKIKEEDKFREKRLLNQAKSNNNISFSNSNNNLIDKSSSLYKINSENINMPEIINIESFLDKDNKVSVYCTAVANPLAFWVQISSESNKSLKKLNNDMYHFYSNNSSPEIKISNINELKVGQLIACMYHGGEWHRAEVLNTKPNPNSDEIDVYYVDYGDSDYVKLEGIRKLDIEFYSLPFQAIECSLSDIQINDTNNSDKFEWSEADLSLFEDLVYSCKWKKLKLEFVEKKDSLYNHNKKVLCKLYDESKDAYVSDLFIQNQNGCAKLKYQNIQPNNNDKNISDLKLIG